MKQTADFTWVKKISFTDNDLLRSLLGEHDRNIKLIEKFEPVKISVRGNILSIAGEQVAVDLVHNLILQLHALLEKEYPIYPPDIDYAHRILSSNGSANLEKIFLDTVFISSKKRS
ncbi:MAG TPA: phosphate starvation-inducible protein PhoH, partial [Syntrophales bacterium]